MTTECNLIIIGAGPGGYETAELAAKKGLGVVLIEKDELGGTCLNRGCIPTKSLCKSAEIARNVCEADNFGIRVGEYSIEYSQAVERKNDVVRQLRDGIGYLLQNVTVVKGEARIISKNSVSVNGDIYSADKIIIATGSKPSSLNIPGSELAINSDYALEMRALPESMVIIGGGVIGMEFASIYNSFGVKVTVLEYCEEILPPFDVDIAKRLRMVMKRQGIDILVGAEVKNIVQEKELMTVSYSQKGKDKTVASHCVLMAVGRKAVIPDGVEALGIKVSKGFIEVDDKMQTSVPGIYAIGDVNGRCMLAHAASAQGRVAIDMPQELYPIPSAVFTNPECAMTGMTEKQCKENGFDYVIGTSFFRANGKALAMGEPDGLVKVIVEKDTNRLLGCHICGPHAADLIQIASVAISGGVSAKKFSECVFPHPTLSEALKSAIEASINA